MRIFISHASPDKKRVEAEIIAPLRAQNLEVWYAPSDIASAKEWERSILQGLRDCDWFLLAMTRRAAQSQWVLNEVHWAMENRWPNIVPVLLEDCDADSFHLGLRRLQRIDMRHPDVEARRKLLQPFMTPGPANPNTPRHSDKPQASIDVGAAGTDRVGQFGDHSMVSEQLGSAQARLLGIQFQRIPAGKFLMGSPPQEAGHAEDERQQPTLIARDFFISMFPVTQAQYQTVIGSNPSWFAASGGGKDAVEGQDTQSFPVDSVSWDEANLFCRRLSEREAGRTYRLPLESEWEYACRAGTTEPFSLGPCLSSEQANFNGNFPYGAAAAGPHLRRTSRVGAYAPNGFGLYDMHGNVWEWCSTVSGESGPEKGGRAVLRGGSWINAGRECRCARRRTEPYYFKDYTTGFRIVLTASGLTGKSAGKDRR